MFTIERANGASDVHQDAFAERADRAAQHGEDVHPIEIPNRRERGLRDQPFRGQSAAPRGRVEKAGFEHGANRFLPLRPIQHGKP